MSVLSQTVYHGGLLFFTGLINTTIKIYLEMGYWVLKPFSFIHKHQFCHIQDYKCVIEVYCSPATGKNATLSEFLYHNTTNAYEIR